VNDIKTMGSPDHLSARGSWWQRWSRVIKLASIALILALILGSDMLADLQRNSTRDLLFAGLAMQPFMLGAIVVASYRHAVLVRTPPVPLRFALVAIVLSGGLNVVMPGRIAELVRATYLRDRVGVRLSDALAAVVVERLHDLLMVSTIGLLGLGALTLGVAPTIVAIPVLAVLGLLLAPALLPRAAGYFSRVGGHAGDFAAQFCRHLAMQTRLISNLRVAALTVLNWTLFFCASRVFFELQPFRDIEHSQVAVVFAATCFAGAIPGLPAGLGAFQAATVLVLGGFGFEFKEALAIGIVLHASQLAICVVMLPILVTLNRTGVGQLVADAATLIARLRQQRSAEQTDQASRD